MADSSVPSVAEQTPPDAESDTNTAPAADAPASPDKKRRRRRGGRRHRRDRETTTAPETLTDPQRRDPPRQPTRPPPRQSRDSRADTVPTLWRD